jgi:hypothetical protein
MQNIHPPQALVINGSHCLTKQLSVLPAMWHNCTKPLWIAATHQVRLGHQPRPGLTLTDVTSAHAVSSAFPQEHMITTSRPIA